MKPHTRTAQTAEMFRPRLDEQLNMKHPLIRLVGLLYLQHANDASD